MKLEDLKAYGKYIIVIGLLIVLFGVGYFLNNNEGNFSVKNGVKNNNDSMESSETIYEASKDNRVQSGKSTVAVDSTQEMESPSAMKVELKGAVEKPGVYEIKEGDRVDDLVKLSGGLKEDADLIRISLAHKLQDEEIIYVYKVGEKENMELAQIQGNITQSKGGVANNNSKSDKVNINLASKEELMKLPGVGEVKAEAIIQYRSESGNFQSPEDLKNVSGIGEKTLAKFIHLVDTK
ncbi:ComEA family DNA-binding protein [Hathewaya proteolytica]|uniref:ComEA family DNA-binding protein n=1 Tax=Hathewaya proteolytica TaxID=29365 RepID=UPI0015BFAB33|nr:ComEA family DNA-binding protein [Hathewaya proteolytica]